MAAAGGVLVRIRQSMSVSSLSSWTVNCRTGKKGEGLTGPSFDAAQMPESALVGFFSERAILAKYCQLKQIWRNFEKKGLLTKGTILVQMEYIPLIKNQIVSEPHFMKKWKWIFGIHADIIEKINVRKPEILLKKKIRCPHPPCLVHPSYPLRPRHLQVTTIRILFISHH